MKRKALAKRLLKLAADIDIVRQAVHTGSELLPELVCGTTHLGPFVDILLEKETPGHVIDNMILQIILDALEKYLLDAYKEKPAKQKEISDTFSLLLDHDIPDTSFCRTVHQLTIELRNLSAFYDVKYAAYIINGVNYLTTSKLNDYPHWLPRIMAKLGEIDPGFTPQHIMEQLVK